MADQLVEPPQDFVDVARRFVCVRVTDMAGHDLDNLAFDFDLTLAFLLVHPEGRVYHRYGGRDATDPLSWSSVAGLLRVMRLTLAEHEAVVASGEAVTPPAPGRRVGELEAWKRRLRGREKPPECVHCHTLNDVLRDEARREGRWSRDDIWIWPSPARVGLELDPVEQDLVRGVTRDGAAWLAGLRAGDRIRRLGDVGVATIADLQWAFERTPVDRSTSLPLAWDRDGTAKAGTLKLAKGWRVGTPLDLAWRPSKWGLSPRPGFGGPALDAGEKRALGLPEDRFAFRVGYLVTWGEAAATGKSALAAGLRKGDVVVSVGGKDDFESVAHFHAWYRLTQRTGTKVAVVVKRGQRLIALQLPVVD
ncbi:MAG: Trx7/PDZ domain-containing (seleno)protein [Planctomycetota bacterium]